MVKAMQEPLVSIIVNTSGTNLDALQRLLKSIAEMSKNGIKYELIIACETNKDEIRSLCKMYELECRVIQTGFWNRCRTANVAIKISKGMYVAVLEDDLVLDKFWLKNMVKTLMERNNNVACVYSSVINPLGSESLVYRTKSRILRKVIEYAKVLTIHSHIKRKGIMVFSLAFMCNKKVILEAGLFDVLPEEPIVGEDYDLAIRINKLGYKIIVSREAIAYHYTRHYARRVRLIRENISSWERLIMNEVYMFAKHIDVLGIAVLFHALYRGIFEPFNAMYREKLTPEKVLKVYFYTLRGSFIGLIKGIIASLSNAKC